MEGAFSSIVIKVLVSKGKFRMYQFIYFTLVFPFLHIDYVLVFDCALLQGSK